MGFFVCFVLMCIYSYISSSIVPFLYRNLWSPLHTFNLLGNKCRSSKDRGMSTEGLLPEEVEISRRGRKKTDRKKIVIYFKANWFLGLKQPSTVHIDYLLNYLKS